jgi:hypothetical protein
MRPARFRDAKHYGPEALRYLISRMAPAGAAIHRAA